MWGGRTGVERWGLALDDPDRWGRTGGLPELTVAVLRLHRSGLANDVIAADLGVDIRTVARHLKRARGAGVLR